MIHIITSATTPNSTEGQFDYYLYKCDRYDWFCEEIYEASAFSLSEQLGNFNVNAPRLISDNANHTVALQINGETVYVHPVK